MRSMRTAVTSSLRGVALAWAMAVLTLPAHASDIDLLIGKLVSKGILTQADAQEIRTELAVEERAPARMVVQDMGATAQATAVDTKPIATTKPGWQDRISLKGDLRVRYQNESLDNVPTGSLLDIDDQDRWRIRWRAAGWSGESP